MRRPLPTQHSVSRQNGSIENRVHDVLPRYRTYREDFFLQILPIFFCIASCSKATGIFIPIPILIVSGP